MNKYLDNIDDDIAAKHLLKHPFYLAWTRGELSKEALTDYAGQYYHHVAAFPTYLSAVHAKCDDPATRKELLNNLINRRVPISLPRWINCRRSGCALRVRESNPRDLRVQNRRAEKTLRLH